MTISPFRISTVITPSASYALADLAMVKDELGIKPNDMSKDGALNRIIGFVSSIITSYCSLPFAPFAVEALNDTFRFEGDSFPGIRFAGENRIALARCPVLMVQSVVQSVPNGATRALIAGTDYQLSPRNGELTRLDAAGRSMRWETYPLSISYIAGYGRLISGEAANIPATSPLTIAAINAASFAFDMGVTFADGTALTPVSANPGPRQYAVSETGQYTFAADDAGKPVYLAYAANAIPADLVSHCLEILTARWASRGRDPALIQRETPGVGTERFWYGNEPGQDGELPPRIQAALDNTYRPPKIA